MFRVWLATLRYYLLLTIAILIYLRYYYQDKRSNLPLPELPTYVFAMSALLFRPYSFRSPIWLDACPIERAQQPHANSRSFHLATNY